MLEKAMRLCEASFGWLRTYDDGKFQLAAIRGVPAPYAEFMALNAPQFGPGTAPARALSGERVIHIPDLSETEEYRAGEPNRRAPKRSLVSSHGFGRYCPQSGHYSARPCHRRRRARRITPEPE
jgi:hypothetical protein